MPVFSKSNQKMHKTARKGETFLVFSLPAGTTCPCAGGCARFCYAKQGRYKFQNVKARREFCLQISQRPYFADYLDGALLDPTMWDKKSKLFIRIHDSGDFYSAEYLQKWIDFAKSHPAITCYAYTKSVSMVKAAGQLPDNLVIAYSWGGKEDHLIEPNDRQVKVFATKDDIPEGWVDGTNDDHVVIDNLRTALVYHGQPKLFTVSIKKKGRK